MAEVGTKQVRNHEKNVKNRKDVFRECNSNSGFDFKKNFPGIFNFTAGILAGELLTYLSKVNRNFYLVEDYFEPKRIMRKNQVMGLMMLMKIMYLAIQV